MQQDTDKLNAMEYVDTHCHLDGPEFQEDLDAVIARARQAGCSRVFVPAIDLPSVQTVLNVSRRYPDYAFPMIGLHPEEVRADWRSVLDTMKQLLDAHNPQPRSSNPQLSADNPQLSAGNPQLSAGIPQLSADNPQHGAGNQASDVENQESAPRFIAVGEVGLDFYWSREFADEQQQAFEAQVQWSVETRLPLMIHCRKAQNEMVAILKKYVRDLPGGVFHCFTGNAQEASQLLEFDRFVLGIGGVLTFKKSHLPEILPQSVPLERIVCETDAPYMAPVPMRGQRNEPAYVRHIIRRLAEAYGVAEEDICKQTNENVSRIFGQKV